MRKMLRLLPTAAILAIALPAAAQQQPMVGIVMDGCTTVVDPTAGPADTAELYGWKVPTSGDCTDMQFDLRAKAGGGREAGGSDGSGVLWGLGSNWRGAAAITDTRVSILVYPPGAANDGYRISVDSDDINSQDLAISMRQTIGSSIRNAVVPNGVYVGTDGASHGFIGTPIH